MDKGKSFIRASSATLPAVAVHDVVVHSRDNELIVGTHGRSIYTVNIEPLQQMADSVMSKPLHLFAIKPITNSASWGRVFNKYDDAPTYEYKMTYYAKQPGRTTAKITTDKGLLLRTLTDTTEAGLNYLTFDYAVDTTGRVAYEKALNEAKKKDDKAIELTIADDKKLYIRPGKYKLTLEQNGSTLTRDFEVRAPERRSRRPATFASPGEFEQWREAETEEGK